MTILRKLGQSSFLQKNTVENVVVNYFKTTLIKSDIVPIVLSRAFGTKRLNKKRRRRRSKASRGKKLMRLHKKWRETQRRKKR